MCMLWMVFQRKFRADSYNYLVWGILLREYVSSFTCFSILTIDFIKKYAILLQSIGVSTGFFVVPADIVGAEFDCYHTAACGMKW